VFMLSTLALNVAHTGFGLGGAALELPLNAWLQNVILGAACVLVAARAARPGPERPAWIVLTVGVVAWSLGNLYWNLVLFSASDPPYPSPADAGWLLFYPLAYLCVGLQVRSVARHLPRSLWLDGIVGLLSVGAVGAALVVAPVLAHAQGSRAAVLTNAAYPMADLILFGLCVAGCALRGWRPGRAWAGLALGFALFAAGDSAYLMRLADGTYRPGTVLDSSWVVGLVVMSLAAWQSPWRPGAIELRGRAALILPFTCGVCALGVLFAGSVGHVPPVAAALAAAAVLASMLRTALTFGEIGKLAEVRRLAATDALTGLPNRREFDSRLRRSLERAAASGERVGLLLIDLDRFKELNDSLGHHAGDLILAQVGPRIRSVLRDDDELARVGGDEFAVVCPGAGAVEAIAERLGTALEEEFTVDGIDVRIGGSIGIAVYPENGDDAETLLQRADVAMYQAKMSHTGYAVYERERDRNTRERLQLIGELRNAVGTPQLLLHYQPKLDLRTGEVREVEALVRWNHPIRGLLPPGAFIPLAEQTGVMRALTGHVLDTALAQCAAWQAAGIDLVVAVNVSAAMFLDGAWADRVAERLGRWGVAPDRLRIEITEETIMLDPERSVAVVRQLAAAGVRASLDDFGTGQSSLSLLKQLPVDELKIDRGFVRDVLTDPANAAIVQTVIELGQRLGLTVVPEGVEDADTLERLTAWGAHSAQGFLISRPVPGDELETWLRSADPALGQAASDAGDKPAGLPAWMRPVNTAPAAAAGDA
jgi:diguanylate cyclase